MDEIFFNMILSSLSVFITVLIIVFILRYVYLSSKLFENYTTNILYSKNWFKLIYINLEKDYQKRQNFISSFHKNTNLTRFDGIYGKSLSDTDKKLLIRQNYITQNFLNMRTNGELGCAMSHMKNLENHVNSNKNLLIFEDDAIINNQLFLELSLFLQELPNDWDMFYLYINDFYLNPVQKLLNKQRIKITKYLYKPINPIGLLGYGINKNSIKRILELIKPLDTIPIDKKFGELIKNKSIIAYTTHKNIVTHPVQYYSNTAEKSRNRKKLFL